MLCTDGLVITMTDEEILSMFHSRDDHEDGEVILNRLLELSKKRGAPDNITIVLIQNSQGDSQHG